MKALKKLAGAMIRQTANVRKWCRGEPISTPSLGSMTLEPDDVRVADDWLADRTQWKDVGLSRDYASEFAIWNESKYAAAFMGGRVALTACLASLDLKAGDEVIVPGYTCVVVPNAIRFAGLTPVYADIELDTYGLDFRSFLDRISPNTKAVIVQHLYGLVCRDFDQVLDAARDRGIYVIEDCAHATGAKHNGKPVGNFGDMAFYSSEQSKIWNTIQGGVAVTNDSAIGERLDQHFNAFPDLSEERVEQLLTNVKFNYLMNKHPQKWITGEIARWKYGSNRLIATSKEEELGIKPESYGCRMPSPIAAIGINQLRKVDRFNSKRRATAATWNDWCESNGHQKPCIVSGSTPVFLRYPVMVSRSQKECLNWAKRELRVTPGVWFKTNVHPGPEQVVGCPNADQAVARCINLPCLLS